MKKRILAFILSICAIMCFACSDDGEKTADDKFLEYDYDLNEYISFCDPNAVQAEFDDPEICTEEEIDEALFQVMLTYADFTPVEGRHAEKYDKVIVDYSGSLNGEIIDDLIANDFEIILGLSGNDDISVVLQNELIGKVAGDVVSAKYTYPENTLFYGDYSGKEVSFVAQVKEVCDHTVYECTDEFVKDIGDYGFQTVQEFRDSLKKDILEEKSKKKINAVWDAFYASVEVKKYPQKELDAYYDSYIEYYSEGASEYNITLEEYLKDYLDIEDVQALYDEAKDYSEYMVKNDMTFILLSQKLGITITDEEYQEKLNGYYADESENYPSMEEFVANYGEKNLRRNVVWDKALLQMVSTAVNTKAE